MTDATHKMNSAGFPRPRSVLFDNMPEIFAFLIGAGSVLAIDVGPALLVGEVLSLTAIFFFYSRATALLRRPPFTLLSIAWCLWLCAQLASDVANGTSATNMIRLDLSIIAFFPALLGLCALLTSRADAVGALCIGVATSSLITLLEPSSVPLIARWKWGAAQSAAFGVVALCTWLLARPRPREGLASFVLLFAGTLGFFTDARSLSGLVILLGLGVAARSIVNIVPRRSVSRPAIAVLSALVFLGAPAAIYLGYSAAAPTGALGEFAKNRYEMQSTRNATPLVVARLELIGSLLAIRDKPFLGHGAWAEDMSYLAAVTSAERRIGYMDPSTRIDSIAQKSGAFLIPIHSMILGAWVWGGVLSIGLMTMLAWLAGRRAFGYLTGPVAMLPLFGFVSLEAVWAILFSPFSSTNRTSLEIMIALCLIFPPVSRQMNNPGRQILQNEHD